MNPIAGNPYRILGLFGNSTEKEITKQISTIKRCAEVSQSKSFDCDFPFLGDIKREEAIVAAAASQIEQAKNKILYSLFWFLNINPADEIAFNNLKDGNIESATEIWEKLITSNTITTGNYSAALNLSTLQLGMVDKSGSFSISRFQKSIELKGLVISSEVFINYVASVTGENTNIAKETLSKEFVDEILQIVDPYLNKINGISTALLIASFKTFPIETRQYLSEKFTGKPISNIESQVEKTKEKRISNPQCADQYGTELHRNVRSELFSLKRILGNNNVRYQALVNKVAEEILLCAIDFFTKNQALNEGDYSESAQTLANHALSLGASGQIKNKIEENLKIFNETKIQDCLPIVNVVESIKEESIQSDEESSTEVKIQAIEKIEKSESDKKEREQITAEERGKEPIKEPIKESIKERINTYKKQRTKQEKKEKQLNTRNICIWTMIITAILISIYLLGDGWGFEGFKTLGITLGFLIVVAGMIVASKR
ncbi:MAG: hypothetical protein LBT25_11605 [Candidatus Symbiothrix sp.]|jgi:hypothetical protein|nr:hypothetical protein [Candidatus Symbiothrix sp.]